MGFDQGDTTRIDTGFPVSPGDGQLLAFQTGRQQPQCPSIAGLAHPLQNGIDSITVAAGVGQPFQHHDAQPLAQQGTVRVGGKGPDPRLSGQGAELAEHHEHFGGDRGIDASGKHQVAAAGAQLLASRVHGQQGGSTGSVNQVVRSAEIEPVSDTPGHHVGYQTWDGVGIEGRQFGFEQGADLGQYGLRHRRIKLPKQLHGLIEYHPVLHHGRVAAV
ncbi:MAG: hypothetical protein RKO24_13115 [Candidatus Competibacter sp.]|nr:hypothetical protein [Candidatus Competibacter sp.]